MRAQGRRIYQGNNLLPCVIVPNTCECEQLSRGTRAMDLPRVPKSGAASAVPEILFQKAHVPLEKVPQAHRASAVIVAAVIVNWSCSREFQQGMSKRDSIGEQKRHM